MIKQLTETMAGKIHRHIHMSGDMFLVTFVCAYECFLGKNNLELIS